MSAFTGSNGTAAVTNGHVNGQTNGHAENGQVNGHLNGNTNGNINGDSKANGAPKPTHPGLFHVHRGADAEAFDTYSTSEVDLPAGALFAPIVGWTPASKPTYATVQTGPSTHLNLNSDLLYVNHSCAPALEFHADAAAGVYEVRVSRDRPLKKGDTLTFFYPSTEWDMAQKFDCLCGEKECWGVIAGAGVMAKKDGGKERLEGYFLNPWVREKLEGGN